MIDQETEEFQRLFDSSVSDVCTIIIYHVTTKSWQQRFLPDNVYVSSKNL